MNFVTFFLLKKDMEAATTVEELTALFRAVQNSYPEESTSKTSYTGRLLFLIAEKALAIAKDPKASHKQFIRKCLGFMPETKRQARVASSKFHPDKGHAHELMASLNNSIDIVFN